MYFVNPCNNPTHLINSSQGIHLSPDGRSLFTWAPLDLFPSASALVSFRRHLGSAPSSSCRLFFCRGRDDGHVRAHDRDRNRPSCRRPSSCCPVRNLNLNRMTRNRTMTRRWTRRRPWVGGICSTLIQILLASSPEHPLQTFRSHTFGAFPPQTLIVNYVLRPLHRSAI